MQQKFLTLFVFLILLQFPNCLKAQKKETIALTPDTSTVFHWGAITIPLSDISVKVPKDKFIEWQPIPATIISINELLLSLRDRMFLYKDQQIVADFKDIRLSFSPSYAAASNKVKRGTSAKEVQKQSHNKSYSLKLEANDPKRLSDIMIQKINQILEHDTRIMISSNKGRFMGHAILKATYASYEPPAIVRHNNLELFKFQLLEPLQGPTLLRIDTNENNRVFNMYKSDNKTKIIHISHFQTATRTVDEKTEGDLEKVLKQASSYPPEETLNLPEYVDYEPTALTLSLGTLVAKPESQNYALTRFNNQKGELTLQQHGTVFKIKSFRLSIFNRAKNWRSYSFITNKKNNWLTHLENLKYETSIYFDKLIIEKNQQTYYLGQAFLFKIGKKFLEE